MKKFISIVILATILTMSFGSVASAVHTLSGATHTPAPTPTSTPGPGVPEAVPSDVAPPGVGVPKKGADLLKKIETMGSWTFAILMTISIIFVIVAAFEFVTGQGNAEKMSGARQKLIYAAIGIGVALIATGFDDVLRSILIGT